MSERKYHCAKCESEWSPAFIKRFEVARSEFIDATRQEFSIQCPTCKAWLNGVSCPNCRKCVPPRENCPECGSLLKSPLVGCNQYH